jgi:DNA-binding MarR family transcriptional regulator
MPYRRRSHFRRRRRLVQRTPQQQAAFDARLAAALQLYVSEAVCRFSHGGLGPSTVTI